MKLFIIAFILFISIGLACAMHGGSARRPEQTKLTDAEDVEEIETTESDELNPKRNIYSHVDFETLEEYYSDHPFYPAEQKEIPKYYYCCSDGISWGLNNLPLCHLIGDAFAFVGQCVDVRPYLRLVSGSAAVGHAKIKIE